MDCFLDVSTLLRWSGPPVGILRVEAELARYALAARPEVGFVFFDPRVHRFRRVAREAVTALLAGRVAIDTGRLTDPRDPRPGTARILARRFAPQLRPIRHPRRVVIEWLERLRSRSPRLQPLADILQAPFMTPKYRSIFFDRQGNRRPAIPVDDILADDLRLDANATILSAGSDWNTRNPRAIAEIKAALGVRLVMVCHDLIPIKLGWFYRERDRVVFTNYYCEAVRFIDRFICLSEATAADLRDFVRRERVKAPWIGVEPLGAELPRSERGRLPDGLAAKRYALYVSTIEPRKNHALLYRVWLRLLAAGIPQAAGFKLVFVGRPGWSTEELLTSLRTDERIRDSLVHLAGVDDEVLAELYASAAFCLYPSTYEGFGLPILEAFSYGRTVMASRGGSIPEVVRDFGPCLDPADEDAWFDLLAAWISDPELPRGYEARLAGFRPMTWPEVAARYFDAAFAAEVGPAPDATAAARHPAASA